MRAQAHFLFSCAVFCKQHELRSVTYRSLNFVRRLEKLNCRSGAAAYASVGGTAIRYIIERGETWPA